MKINGIEVPNTWEPDPLVLGRGRDAKGEPRFLVIRASGLRNYDEFDSLCPEPKKTQGYFTRDGFQPDDESPKYLDDLRLYRRRRWAYMVIKTLEPTGIEWDKVCLDKPKTWLAYEDELRSFLLEHEYAKVIALVQEANALDSGKLEENRQSFFLQQAKLRLETPDGQSGDPENSPSSGPA